MRDMLPSDHSVASYLKKIIRYRCRQAGIRRISTPIFERPVILDNLPPAHWGERVQVQYSHGETNDLLLRKNFLLSILRTYMTHKMYEGPQPVELYSLDMCFRSLDHWGDSDHTVLQQFLGFDLQILGEDDPVLDAQVIKLWHTICSDIGLSEFVSVRLAKIGTVEAREQFLVDFGQYYSGKERSLCGNCAKNIQQDPLKMLSCPEEDCQILLKLAPKLETYLDQDTKTFYQNLEEYLHILQVPFTWQEYLYPEDMKIYAPLYGEIFLDDKKIGTIHHFSDLLADESFSGVSGRSLFVNLEEVISSMQSHDVFVPYKDNIHVYIAQLGVEAKKYGLELLYSLRQKGIKAIASMGKGSMQEQVDTAYKFRIPYALLVGRMEVNENIVIVRDMTTGKRENVPRDQITAFLLSKIPDCELDQVSYDKMTHSHYAAKQKQVQ